MARLAFDTWLRWPGPVRFWYLFEVTRPSTQFFVRAGPDCLLKKLGEHLEVLFLVLDGPKLVKAENLYSGSVCSFKLDLELSNFSTRNPGSTLLADICSTHIKFDGDQWRVRTTLCLLRATTIWYVWRRSWRSYLASSSWSSWRPTLIWGRWKSYGPTWYEIDRGLGGLVWSEVGVLWQLSPIYS